MSKGTERGFTELEFSLLVAGGLVVVGILAHFLFSQSIQVERLNSLVARDSVRLAVESALLDPANLVASAKHQPKDQTAIRACILGEHRCQSKVGCCSSHSKAEFDLLAQHGDSPNVLPISGTSTAPSCLNPSGEPLQTSSGTNCFASCASSVEFICEGGLQNCKSASFALIKYRLQFNSPFLNDDPKLTIIERTLPLVLGTASSK